MLSIHVLVGLKFMNIVWLVAVDAVGLAAIVLPVELVACDITVIRGWPGSGLRHGSRDRPSIDLWAAEHFTFLRLHALLVLLAILGVLTVTWLDMKPLASRIVLSGSTVTLSA